MVNYIRECVGCTGMGLPCMGHACTQGRMELRCDWCDREVDGLYNLDRDEVCEDCLLGTLEMREEDDEHETTYLVNGEWMLDCDALGEFEKIEF